jgi:hypothetical protein
MTAANLGSIAGKDLLMEGGKTLLSAQLDKRYGINPMLTYGGATALQGGIGAIGTEQGFMGGVKGAFTNPVSGKPLIAPGTGEASSNLLGLGKESGITGLGTGADIGLGIGATSFLSGMGGEDQPEKQEEKVKK